jgi:Reductase C-terminal
MLGRDVAYDRIPYFFSDQYDVGMEYSGFATEGDEVVFRGDSAGREFIAFWLSGGRVVAGMNVKVWDVNEDLQALIRSGRGVDTTTLSDPDTRLHSLVGEGTNAAELNQRSDMRTSPTSTYSDCTTPASRSSWTRSCASCSRAASSASSFKTMA